MQSAKCVVVGDNAKCGIPLRGEAVYVSPAE